MEQLNIGEPEETKAPV